MKIDGATKIIGIFGNPISHTASPRMQQAALDALNLNICYLPFLVEKDQLETAIKAIKALNLIGVNITVPFKKAVIPYLDEITPLAKNIGAVNTIINKDQKLIGYNTDALGFLRSLKQHTPLKNKRITILGAGGAAKAVAYSLLNEQIQSLQIINRTVEKAQLLATQLQANQSKLPIQALSLADPSSDEILANSDIIVNATSIGIDKDQNHSPITNFSWVTKDHFFYDLIYQPSQTLFLTQAHKQGAKILNGLEMLLYQGAEAFRLFTNQEPPIELMQKALMQV